MFKIRKSANTYFCESSLEEYVKSIPKVYKKIGGLELVKATFNVLKQVQFPVFYLVTERIQENKDFIKLKNYRILEGISDSLALKKVYEAFNFYLKKVKESYKEKLENTSNFHLQKRFEKELKAGEVEFIPLKLIISFFKGKEVNENIFKEGKQWFILTELSKDKQVDRLITLKRGQINLVRDLLLLTLPKKSLRSFIYSKDKNPIYFSKTKKVGQIHFSHFTEALVIFFNGTNDIVKDNNLKIVIKFLRKFDKLLEKNYPEIGIQWIVREAVLLGVFDFLTSYYLQFYYSNDKKSFKNCFDNILRILKQNISKLMLEEFLKLGVRLI